MSEKLHQNHEKGPEKVEASVESKRNLERIKKAGEAVNEAEKLPKAEQARHKAEEEAIPGKDIAIEQKPASETGGFGIERALKAKAYQKSLHRIRSQLSTPERAFSKFTHNNVVDKTSTVVGKTVARPTGILGGAICAFLGSVILLYASKHYGFSYNYLLFSVLFIGGYMVGTVIELLLWVVLGRRRQKLS